MQKTIMITGATDGIGLETARLLAAEGHHLLLHGRNEAKLEQTEDELARLAGDARVDSYLADLSDMTQVVALAKGVIDHHTRLDVLINNAGVFKVPEPRTQAGLDVPLDVRFAVNTVAPWLLTRRLLPLLGTAGRVVNLSSAAQSPVDLDALAGKVALTDDFAAYAQSKLALTMWSRHLAQSLGTEGPAIIAVNPGSMLGSKMVKQGFGVAGNDIRIGADILVRSALADEFADASGQYYDNDSGAFASPHQDALDSDKCAQVVTQIVEVIQNILQANIT